MNINVAKTMFGFMSRVIYVVICCKQPYRTYWALLVPSTQATSSLLHPENEPEQNVNNFWSCFLGNVSVSLSRRRQVRRYLGIRAEDSGGVAGIVLRKGGDVGRHGESGEMVAV